MKVAERYVALMAMYVSRRRRPTLASRSVANVMKSRNITIYQIGLICRNINPYYLSKNSVMASRSRFLAM